MIIQP